MAGSIKWKISAGLPELHTPAMGMAVFTAHVSEPFRNAVVGVMSGGLIGTPGRSHGANRLRIDFEIDHAKISGPSEADYALISLWCNILSRTSYVLHNEMV